MSAESVNSESVLLGMSEVLKLLGISRPTLMKMIAAGTFPEPIRAGSRYMWAVMTVNNWLKAKI